MVVRVVKVVRSLVHRVVLLVLVSVVLGSTYNAVVLWWDW